MGSVESWEAEISPEGCVWGRGGPGFPPGLVRVLGKAVLRAERWVPGEGLCGRQVEVTVALAGRVVKHRSVWVRVLPGVLGRVSVCGFIQVYSWDAHGTGLL